MKEIKFRAWDKQTKTMRLVKSINYADDGFAKTIIVHLVGGISFGYVHGESCELLQYTGLKDKNGKEIYEGDVIQDNLGYGAVEYRETRAGFRLNYVDGLAKWFLDYTDDEFKTIEVIGNIYESPVEANQ